MVTTLPLSFRCFPASRRKNRHQAVVLGLCRFYDGLLEYLSDGVDGNIDAAELLLRFRKDSLHIGHAGKITLNGECIAASLLDGCDGLRGSILGRIAVAVDDDLRALLRESGADEPTKILCASGDEGNLSSQFLFGHMSSLDKDYSQGRSEGISQQALAAALNMHASRLVALIDDLESRGLLLREVHATDRRLYSLALTAKGKDTLFSIREVADEHDRLMCAALTAEETVTLQALLSRMANQMGLESGVHPGYRTMSSTPSSIRRPAGSSVRSRT